MCQMNKIENMTAIKTKKNGNGSSKIENMTSTKSKEIGSGSGSGFLASKSSGRKSYGRASPAFQGAKFDKRGYCLHHPSIQLVDPMKDESGKLVYQELKVTCPSCQSAKHKSRKNTSLGGGKVRSGRRLHGAPKSASRPPSRSRSVSRDDRGNNGQPLERKLSRSKSRDGRAPRKEFNTPFDTKGRCHYHKNVQLAAKKITGGWKVLHSACPKCMEDNLETGGDDRSVRSGSSRRSARSGVGGDGVHGNANGQFDKNGCCVLHTHIQVAKKRVFGTGFKVVRACPACEGGDVDADDYSVRSGRSASSRKSSRSVKSTASSRGKPGKASKSGRYGAMPFDGDGYCCRHPNVQLAKKKALGGFKIVFDVCPECSLEDAGSARTGRRKPSRRKSGTGRMFDDSGSETSSFKSSKSSKPGMAGGGSSSGKRKRIRVRNLKTEDEEGKPGRYSGYVDDDHRPHGNGVMKYTDGDEWEGVWHEGSQAHGKMKKAANKKKTAKSTKQ